MKTGERENKTPGGVGWSAWLGGISKLVKTTKSIWQSALDDFHAMLGLRVPLYLFILLLHRRAKIRVLSLKIKYLSLERRYLLIRLGQSLPQNGRKRDLFQHVSNPSHNRNDAMTPNDKAERLADSATKPDKEAR